MDTDHNFEKFNDWAKVITGKHLHVSLAKSGLRGYYCIGCNKQMQAVKPKNPLHKAYYRHHAANVDKDNIECTFSSTDYRERLAGQMFARLKEISLPPVYKYPPANIDGVPNLLVKKRVVRATTVKLDISFYEDEQGRIVWAKNPEIDKGYFLIKPNVTFFENTKPVLFIEFVTSHKVADEKKSILKRLGIDTVQIVIPRASEEEIEKKLKSIHKVKWVYNEVESNTEYIPVQRGNSERISDIDEDQRKLFEESISCRAAQIGNLIRSIRRSLESQSYKHAERQFNVEIERIESVRDAVRARLDELEKNYEREAYGEIEPYEIEIEQGLIDLEQQQIAMEQYYRVLEDRYNRKRDALDDQDRILSGVIRKQLDQGAGGEALGAVYEARYAGLQRDTERIRGNIGRVINEHEAFRKDLERLKMEERERFGRDKSNESESFERKKRNIEESRIRLESEISSVGESEAEKERGIDAEFESLRNESIERIDKRDVSGNSELSKRIATLFEIRGFLSNYDERTNTYKRYKAYLDFVRGGAWKTW